MAIAYCTDAQLVARLPDGLPTTVDTSGERAAYITSGSRFTDAMVGKRFSTSTYDSASQKFPNVSGDPSTPELITQIAVLFAAAELMDIIGWSSGMGGPRSDELRQQAYDLAKMVRDGEVDVLDSDGTSYGTGWTLSSTTKTTRPIISTGKYDSDGVMISDEAGSLDKL